MNPSELRASIPVFEDVRYMNTGASGPSPRPVVEDAQAMLARHEYDAASEEGPYPFAFDFYEDVRETVADFLGAEETEVALTQSTADGITRVAGAFDWEAGDVVVRTDLEHPAGVLPWSRLERHGCEVRVVPTEGGRIDREAYREAVQDAKLVCFSALTWNYGTSLPVSELVEEAHDAGAFVLVDAVQVPGHSPLDVTDWGADAVAAAGHKWLLGTWGGGFLYVSESAANDLEPTDVSYRSVEDPSAEEYELKTGAPRFEVGTTNLAPYAALRTAMETMESVGLDAVESRLLDLAGRLTDGVPNDKLLSPEDPESGLVTVRVDDPEATVRTLKDDYGIVIRPIPSLDGSVRASLHAINTETDVDRLLEALEETGW
ncbi:cysteine desulfurase, class V aminotransferase [Halogeometricum pallidum JCM 14848]|uniref:Cysteine desulfurase, class V aminotransferase n=1 Tax=Halogeometricum pallidum JCM 14848 TaxID=1227487 RepID=M0D7R4_HALPD|nr:aminotransferase class V-fold PLP-dependent enzyme [Halogeometricum pallidum]ELZ31506.1 cysteine desulfurase, class V aminotransferase [Halogeometricum pallidum JCM 14848]